MKLVVQEVAGNMCIKVKRKVGSIGVKIWNSSSSSESLKLWKTEILLQKHRGKEKSVKLRTSWQVDAEEAGWTAGTSEGTPREDQRAGIKTRTCCYPAVDLG